MSSLIWSHEHILGYARKIYRMHLQPNCLDTGIFFVMPWVRKKYWEDFPGSHSQATRHLSRMFVAMKSKSVVDEESFAHTFARYVMRCDVPEGSYVAECDGNSYDIPKSAMAVYASIVPHDEMQGMYKASQDFLQFLYDHAPHDRFMAIPHLHASMHKSPCKGRMKVLDLDVDTKDTEKLAVLIDFLKSKGLGDAAEIIMETRGGFHVILPAKKVGKNYNDLFQFCKDNEDWCTKSASDNVVPLPGTIQGGFNVRLMEHIDDLVAHN